MQKQLGCLNRKGVSLISWSCCRKVDQAAFETGLFDMLDEECFVPKATDQTYAEKARKVQKNIFQRKNLVISSCCR